VERQKLAALPTPIRGLLGGDGTWKPQDYTQLVRIAESLSPSEWVDYASRVTARTTDLDQLEAAVNAFREQSRKREANVARRKELQHKLYGTESLYGAYKDYLQKKADATGSWQPGAGDNMIWVEPSQASIDAARAAEKDLTDRLVAAGITGG